MFMLSNRHGELPLVQLVSMVGQIEAGSSAAPAPPRSVVSALALFTLVGLLLAILLIVGWYILIRTVRRHRAMAAEEHKPTAYLDVWAMHKTPEMDGLEDENDEPWGLPRNGA